MRAQPIVVMFSGGMDSSAVAVHYLSAGHAVHLLTMVNGAQKWVELAQYKAEWIRKRFGAQCSWAPIECTYLFHELAIANLEADTIKYGNLVCCGCKLAMLAEAILYSRRHGIRAVADGFRKQQAYYPEQTPGFMNAAGRLARRYGITCLHPFYTAAAAAMDDLALQAGVPPSPIQPYCIFERNRVRQSRKIAAYVQSKLPQVRAYIAAQWKNPASESRS